MCVCGFTFWYICDTYMIHRASLVAQLVKNPPAMQETLVRFLGQEDPLKKGQAPHSGILGLLPVAQTGENLPAVQETWVYPCIGKILWRRERLPTPVFWPGESQGWGSLAGCSPWGGKESDTTEQLTHTIAIHMHTHTHTPANILRGRVNRHVWSCCCPGILWKAEYVVL